MFRYLVLVTIASSTLSCAAQTSGPMMFGAVVYPSDAVRPSCGEPVADPDDIYEVVFLYLFDHNESAFGQSHRSRIVYFLEVVEGADPSANLLSRFASYRPTVKSKSNAYFKNGTSEVREKGSRKPGLLFYISSVCSISQDEIEVEGGYYEGNMSSSGHTFRVTRAQTGWKVVSDRRRWIS